MSEGTACLGFLQLRKLWAFLRCGALFSGTAFCRHTAYASDGIIAAASEQSPLATFCASTKHPPLPLFLLLRKKSRLYFLFVCKRTHDENTALPTFCGIEKVSGFVTVSLCRNTLTLLTAWCAASLSEAACRSSLAYARSSRPCPRSLWSLGLRSPAARHALRSLRSLRPAYFFIFFLFFLASFSAAFSAFLSASSFASAAASSAALASLRAFASS